MTYAATMAARGNRMVSYVAAPCNSRAGIPEAFVCSPFKAVARGHIAVLQICSREGAIKIVAAAVAAAAAQLRVIEQTMAIF